MSPAARVSLAIAVAWAGGFGSFAGPGWWRLAAGSAVLLSCAWLRPWVCEAGPDDRLRGAVRIVALALMLGLLARALGRVVIAVPAALWAVPIAGAGLVLGLGDRRPRVGVALAVMLALAAALAGGFFEAAGPQPRGRALSGPILGVHPRQVTSVRIDGYGPHDLVVDDYVDPPGGQGYDPHGFAQWLELELHAIAQTHYADGPARARVAFEGAEVRVVDALVPPGERELHASTLGIEVRSGTTGEGSKVEFMCPGQTLPRSDASPQPSRACPRKYVVDGSTGLGLSSRFPGYAEVRGRDRARLARWFDWPHGDERRDRRSLVLESAVVSLLLVLGSWALTRRRASVEIDEMAAALAGGAALLLVAIAAVAAPGSIDAASDGPTLLVLAVLALAPTSADAPAQRSASQRLAIWPLAGLLVLLCASPLAGRGDVVATIDAAVETLVLGVGLDWSTSRALAGGLAAVALAAGLGACSAALFDSREQAAPGRSRSAEAIRLLVALAVTVALALRKPAGDLALLQAACALLLASTLRFARRTSSPARLS